MPENDPGRAPPSADRGTQLGAGTGALTLVLTVVLRLLVGLGRILRVVLVVAFLPLVVLARVAVSIGRLLPVTATWVAANLRRIAPGLLRPIRAILDPLGRAGRRLGLAVYRHGASLIARARRSSIVRAVGRSPRVALRLLATAGLWLGLALRRRGARLIARVRHSAIVRAVLALKGPIVLRGRRLGAWLAAEVRRAALGLVVACRRLGVILGRLADMVHGPVLGLVAAGRRLGLALRRGGGWLIARARHSAIVRTVSRRPRVAVASLLIAAVAAAPIANSRIALGLLVVLLAVLLPPLLFLMIYWVIRLAARHLLGWLRNPLAALGRLIAERMVAARQRAAHSLQVARTKATFQATRSLQAPITAAVGAAPSMAPVDSPVPFLATVYQNEYLPRGGVEVNAIITVTAGDGAGADDGAEGRAPEAAEVILLDCSGSMAYPLAKLRAAQEATAAAIDALREGTWFAVVRATERAELAYPPTGGLVQMSPDTREAAKRALSLMWPEGGTAMGGWLLLARELLASRPSAIAHAILLTDGRNESESPDALDSALAACSGRFQCDCRGVGTDWEVSELRRIASQLLGSVDIVADPADLEADFRSMAEAAMAKTVGGAALRVWTPRGATVQFLRQVSPTIEDLTSRAVPLDELNAEYPAGAWGDESRDYHLCVRVPVREIGEEMLAARLSVVMGSHAASQALIKAIWTDDEQLSTRINREVAHYTGQAELAEVIQEGLGARRSGDEHTATVKLGRAVQLAAASGNQGTIKLLAGVVDVEDAATGTVRLKPHVDDADEMALDTRSTKTVRVRSARPMSAPQAR